MFQIIGYIVFIIITVALCMGAAVVGTITGIKQDDATKSKQKRAAQALFLQCYAIRARCQSMPGAMVPPSELDAIRAHESAKVAKVEKLPESRKVESRAIFLFYSRQSLESRKSFKSRYQSRESRQSESRKVAPKSESRSSTSYEYRLRYSRSRYSYWE